MNKKLSLPELRKNARIALGVEYDLSIGDQHYTGTTGDISLGGASLRTSTPALTVNQALKTGRISLFFGEDELSVDCMIVYVGNANTPGFVKTGITFKNMSEDDKYKLLKFMIQNL